jgi:carboxypeptidase Q
MNLRLSLTLAACLAFAATAPVLAAEKVDRAAINRIADEGFNRSEVLETAAWLSDRIGGRLTNSPSMRQAETWTQAQFRRWGLKDVHLEGFEFGRGWGIDHASARMLTPRVLELRTIPIAWTPATNGKVQAPVIVAPIAKDGDFDAWKGKLRGRIVLISRPTDAKDPVEPAFSRLTDEDLRKTDDFTLAKFSADTATRTKQRLFGERVDAFLAAEGAVAWVRMSRVDGSLIHGDVGYSAGYRVGRTPSVPGAEMAAEDYRRLARLTKSGAPVSLELDHAVRYFDEDPKAYNVIADIPGRDPKAGYVMAGGHLDSWIAGDGAADNGAGVAVVMEAARILSALGVKPKRTIRFALWSAEEQGGLGSLAYIEQHLATRPERTDPDQAHSWGWDQRFPITLKPGYADFGGYFNIDSGGGKIRGIYAETNVEIMSIFQEWLEPFASMGASTVAAARITQTDHVDMQNVGLPAFQFIQDPLDYFTQVHHTNIDTYDHLRGDDLRQNAVILAAFLLLAAERDQPLPKMPLPTAPRDTDPFAYPTE